MPAVEEYGVQPVPRELRTVGFRDLFALNFCFNLTPLNYVFGSIGVIGLGLPLWWAFAGVVLGSTVGTALLSIPARAGVDYGLPGQVAMRGTFGQWGSRLLTSPYKIIAGAYWFSAQALAGAFGFQAIFGGLTGHHLRLVPIALALAAVQGALAVLGFDVMRYFVRFVLPLMVGFTAVLIVLDVTSSRPEYSISRVFDSPGQAFTWAGFAALVTTIAGAQLTNVTNIADLARYARSRRELTAGLVLGSTLAAGIAAWVGGYAAVATGESNPFVAAVDLTSSAALLAVLIAAIVVQTTAVNIMNVYTAGLSLSNTAPRLGRLLATAGVAAVAIALSGFPDVIEHAQRWIVHLGNVAAPLTGVVLADYALLKRGRLDVPALFDPDGHYRYLGGLNVAAVAATAVGIGVYYAIPHPWVKVVWGVGIGAVALLVLDRLQSALAPRLLAAAPAPE